LGFIFDPRIFDPAIFDAQWSKPGAVKLDLKKRDVKLSLVKDD